MMRATTFWTETAYVDAGFQPDPSLRIYPEGEHRGSDITVLFRLNTTPDEQLAIADKVLAGVQAWRDGIAARVEGERTAADELAAAREEIARLKAEAEAAS
ncbi:hypothetical protein NLX86_19105 [Streptomyces sp. A3M-1-3]|uniref:hypothetical protein n=1 Tax=Streptomyces sp. A3M-1-3 TaxID=2962044 RepID=UPI0020B8ABBC|nr:hypothetical protein [Streptomyces sp. A3M-1-3]MCP3820128.1 hypothetical protein [Streptomyces sp. A3M-1-3]